MMQIESEGLKDDPKFHYVGRSTIRRGFTGPSPFLSFALHRLPSPVFSPHFLSFFPRTYVNTAEFDQHLDLVTLDLVTDPRSLLATPLMR